MVEWIGVVSVISKVDLNASDAAGLAM